MGVVLLLFDHPLLAVPIVLQVFLLAFPQQVLHLLPQLLVLLLYSYYGFIPLLLAQCVLFLNPGGSGAGDD